MDPFRKSREHLLKSRARVLGKESTFALFHRPWRVNQYQFVKKLENSYTVTLEIYIVYN